MNIVHVCSLAFSDFSLEGAFSSTYILDTIEANVTTKQLFSTNFQLYNLQFFGKIIISWSWSPKCTYVYSQTRSWGAKHEAATAKNYTWKINWCRRWIWFVQKRMFYKKNLWAQLGIELEWNWYESSVLAADYVGLRF